MRKIRVLRNAGASSFWDEQEERYVHWSEMDELLKGEFSIDTLKVTPRGFDLIIAFQEKTS